MTTHPEKPARPGAIDGRTSEFTLFFKVKPGHGKLLRDIFQQRSFDQLSRQVTEQIGTLHDARWVLFDDDTRLMFATSFDGDWDVYIEEFARRIPQIFDDILIHAEDYPGINAPVIKEYIVAHQVTACSYFRAIPDATVRDLRRARAVYEAYDTLVKAYG
ncbi:hypothetical protein [Streptomyces niger]|uniref:hypothetical protein n=1 Tax=Streptomyces niger TaxID=66373 RepID=UPI00069BBD51|nr:hypothetical protein [Streptomyces niger]